MQKYSDFFKTLHDEQGPTGKLGRGTHYSVLQAIVFHDAMGQHLREGQSADFAVIWDEDHDDRVFEPIEKIYRCGLLPCFSMFGERKGTFTAILTSDACDESRLSVLQGRLSKVTQQLGNGDSWPARVIRPNSPDKSIIDDTADKVTLYLNNLMMLWKLGVKEISQADAETSWSQFVRPGRQGVTLSIAKDGDSFDVCVMLTRDSERGTELKQLYQGRQTFANALSRAAKLSQESGFNGYYEIKDETPSAGKKTFATRADWVATLTEIDRQLAPLKDKSGLNWSGKGPTITADHLERIPSVGPQLAQLMELRASLHRRQPAVL